MSLPQVSMLDTARSITPRSATPDVAPANPNAGAAAPEEGQGMQLRNEFLEMMVAQIQNQDPTNPLDGAQYVTQLAQFSMVEGIESLKIMQQQSVNMMQNQQVLQSTDLIGQEVMVPSDNLELSEGGTLRGQIELGAEVAEQVDIKVTDEFGKEVATQSWGESKPGELDYEFTLPAGKYTIEVTATMEGETVTTRNYVAGEVERVALSATGAIMLQVIGVGDVALFDAIEFGHPAPTTTTTLPRPTPRTTTAEE